MEQILLDRLDEDNYLHSEELSPFRRELLYGTAHLRSENSANHNRIVGNLASCCIETNQENLRTFAIDMKLRLDSGNIFYYPDVMLVCDAGDNEPYFKTSPCMIAEVLSRSTELTDRREKWAAYQKL